MSAESRHLSQGAVGQRLAVSPAQDSDRRGLRVIGGVLLLISLAAALVYAMDFDFAAYTTFRAPLSTASGTVTAVEPTDTYEPGTGWSHRDDRTRIVAVQYVSTDPAGIDVAGTSYLPGSSLRVGATVTVEHPTGRPDVSRIQGYRTAKFDRGPLVLDVMAGTGLLLLTFGLFGRREPVLA